jgi:palmitoyl transferase
MTNTLARLAQTASPMTRSTASMSAHAVECKDLWSFVGRVCAKSAAAWDHGDNELIVTGYAYHLRSTYTEEKLRELNERAWGGGWARTITDPDGDTHQLFAFAFHESHGKIQWNAGYLYTTWWGPQDGLRAGIGLAAFIVQRPDIASGVPIPVLLPIASVAYGKVTVMGAFIPTVNGGINNGSVAFLFARYAL